MNRNNKRHTNQQGDLDVIGKTVVKKVGKKTGSILVKILSVLLTIALICLITGIIVGCAFAIYIKNYIDPTIDESLLITGSSEQTTKIYYYDFTDRENRIGDAVELEDQRIYGNQNSLWASYGDIPTYLAEAFVSVEDHRFWEHNGVDWYRTLGAVANYFFGFDSRFGGSTITQQLVKNLTKDDDVTIQRKVQEILRALNLEKTKSKQEILELYLNIVPLSQNCVGVKAAAKTYFDKELKDLTLVECACIASITNAPTKYDPLQNPDNNKERRNTVLYLMREFGKITQEEFDEAYNADITLAVAKEENADVSADTKVNSWYVDTVYADVRDALMEKYDISSTIASNLIYSGGLSIFTVMDPDIQSAMEEVYEDETFFPENTGGMPAESAMAIVDPYTGDLLGIVGSRGEKRGNLTLNYATQTKRAPGSSIKPLSVYAPALEEGIISYGSVYDDVPVSFGTNPENPSAWPKNLPTVYRGLTTVNSAVERSVNTVAVRVLNDLSIDRSFDYLTQKLGFDYLIDYAEYSDGTGYTDKGQAALALGQLNYGVTVRDMATAYCVFPSGGIYRESRSFLYVYDNQGNLILSNDDAGDVVFSEDTSYIMTKMLQNVMNNGTGTSVTLRKSIDVAGKTGTAGNDFDRWFVGYTPYFVGAVWYGYSMPKIIGLAANPSNKIWDAVMTRAHENILADAKNGTAILKKFDDNSPGDIIKVTYCRDSGKLMTDACRLDPRGSRADTGYFTVDSAPTGYCDCHVIVKYDKSTGGVAHEYSIPENVISVGFVKVTSRAFPVQVYVEDAQYVYRDLPGNVRPGSYWSVPFFINTIPSGTYVGISNVSGGRQYNAFSYENYDFSAFDGGVTTETEPPDETSGEPDETEEAGDKPAATAGETEATDETAPVETD